MDNVQIMTGNQAAAQGAKLCRVQVVAAYPITPQSSLMETLSQYIEAGQMKAEFVRVESEHSAMTVCISASTVGARAFTASSSHGLLYMHEQLHWAAGSRLPLVMCCVNRAVGAPWSIFNDQQDSISQRDTGWLQIYCRNNQEIIDTLIQAYKIAETVFVPVMICYDGFILSHTTMPVAVPTAEEVDDFLPPYKPHTILDPANPKNINPVIFPNRKVNHEGVLCHAYMEFRNLLHQAALDARQVIIEVNREYAEKFGRDHGGMLWTYKTEDAELLVTSMGSLTMELSTAVDLLREQGVRVGLVGIRVYRPFPRAEVAEAFRQAKAILVFEKDISYGYEGALCSDLKAAFYESKLRVPVVNYIAGLGGRDVKARELVEAITETMASLGNGTYEPTTKWLNCHTGC
ncbi:MAG: pyruvate ferredoxin oxidoreductase [Smithellaceae bacterium]|nr:pyruvate ferredoxin oxidoreductase [Smithellaceae bacterium]